jgi:hypothetical protein
MTTMTDSPAAHRLTIDQAPPSMRKVTLGFNRAAHMVGDVHQAGAWVITRQDGRKNYEVKVRLATGKWSHAVPVADDKPETTRAAIQYILQANGEHVPFPF